MAIFLCILFVDFGVLYGMGILLDCYIFFPFSCFGLLHLDEAHHLYWPQDLKDFVRAAGEVTYADTDRAGNGYGNSFFCPSFN